MKPVIREFESNEILRLMSRKAGDAAQPAEPKAKAAKGKKKKKKRVEKPFDLQHYTVGDDVDVHYRIVEGDKERIQVFSGTVIRTKGTGLAENFTVRRIVQSEGVERIFPLHSPKLMKVVVTRRGRVRRAKLYYLRDRVGKATKVKELLGDKGNRLKARAEKAAARFDDMLARAREMAKSADGETEGGDE